MRKCIVRIALLCAALPLAACADDLLPRTVACPNIGRAAVLVEVRDAATGGPLTGATLEIRDGGAVATAGGSNAPSTLVAGSAAGLYDVRVSRAGYQDWTRDDVRVEWASEECGQPATVSLTAGLVPAP